MFTKQEQRSWIKSEVARGCSAQNSYQGLREARGDAALSYRTVVQGVKLFREGRDAVQDDPMLTLTQFSVFLLCRMSIVDGLRVTMAKLCSCTGLVGPVPEGRRRLIGRIITLDETWAQSYEPHLKQQSNKWKHPGSPRPKKVCPTQSNVKAMFIVTYDTDGVILHHTVPQRQTVNSAYYCKFLHNYLRPVLRRKRRHLLATNPIILHDNARAHTADAVKDLLRRWQWEILQHPPYSPDESVRL
ncbi:hypothetical protein B7P43_G08670 [Cryptotermes secundus]|uniref:Mariner Mos1 transposase n=1 Tax=Cryptotermes secundus TaxID=105785 RepID=A0A2J7PCA4_9NEOP|nr:hypothetical protein B7P43_G08670 [Cryptotermes secundus]